MKSLHLLLPVIIAGLFSCKQKNQPAPAPVNTVTDTTHTTYLPVADFIRSDIKRVDSFAGGILQKRIIDNRKDSLFIQPADFHRFAANFLGPELDSASFKNNFTEESLMDETTEMLNFIYTSKNPALSVRKVIVYVNPSLSVDQVSRIYMEKEFAGGGDTLVQQKLTWKMRESCYQLTVRLPKEGGSITSVEKMIWDPQHFAAD
jgi:hypothetical protein